MTTKVLQILANNNIKKADIQTSGFLITPQYDYSSGTAKLTGQLASETISVTVRKIDSLGSIIDPLSAINGIIINGINFDIADKTPFFNNARILAF